MTPAASDLSSTGFSRDVSAWFAEGDRFDAEAMADDGVIPSRRRRSSTLEVALGLGWLAVAIAMSSLLV